MGTSLGNIFFISVGNAKGKKTYHHLVQKEPNEVVFNAVCTGAILCSLLWRIKFVCLKKECLQIH